jgi:hypothetical protein
MTAAGRFDPRWTKEIRMLAGPFLALAGVIVVGAVVGSGPLVTIGYLAWLIGPCALGAIAFGQDLTHGTLGFALAQPESRASLYRRKMLVLVILLAGLTVTFVTVTNGTSAIAFPVLAGLFLAPWLAMLTRSVLGGVVLPLAFPALVLIGHAVATSSEALSRSPGLEQVLFTHKWITVAICLVAAVGTWRSFTRLEVTSGAGIVRLPSFPRLRAEMATVAAPASLEPVFWLVIKKELRIQQATFLIAVPYVVTGAVLAWLEPAISEDVRSLFVAATVLFAVFVPIFAGAVASAEERQFRTLEWQTLLPVASWKQWAIKVGVVMAIALLLAMGAPELFRSVTHNRRVVSIQPAVPLAIVLLASAGLYFSSLATSALRALLTAVPFVAVFAALANGSVREMGLWLRPLARPVYLFAQAQHYTFKTMELFRAVVMGTPLITGALLALVLIRLGLTNHRSAEHGWARGRRQILWIAAAVVSAAVLWQFVIAFYYGAAVGAIPARN